MSGFKNFILRGNLVDLAVAVVIGAQFSGLVRQFVQSFISPLLALAGGQRNGSRRAYRCNNRLQGYFGPGRAREGLARPHAAGSVARKCGDLRAGDGRAHRP